MAIRAAGRQRSGLPIDSGGGPAVDPTKNVENLVIASNLRQDDLREETNKRIDAELRCQETIAGLRVKHEEKIGELREGYQEKIARAESGRLDSIRQVDREEVAKTAVAANTAITTLAKQTTDLQQTLAKQVTDTAAAQETRNSAQYSDINKRLSALELSSSEGKGKQAVSDPQMDRLVQVVDKLAIAQANTVSTNQGGKAMWGYVAAGFGFLLTLLLIVGALFALKTGGG